MLCDLSQLTWSLWVSVKRREEFLFGRVVEDLQRQCSCLMPCLEHSRCSTNMIYFWYYKQMKGDVHSLTLEDSITKEVGRLLLRSLCSLLATEKLISVKKTTEWAQAEKISSSSLGGQESRHSPAAGNGPQPGKGCSLITDLHLCISKAGDLKWAQLSEHRPPPPPPLQAWGTGCRWPGWNSPLTLGRWAFSAITCALAKAGLIQCDINTAATIYWVLCTFPPPPSVLIPSTSIMEPIPSWLLRAQANSVPPTPPF